MHKLKSGAAPESRISSDNSLANTKFTSVKSVVPFHAEINCNLNIKKGFINGNELNKTTPFQMVRSINPDFDNYRRSRISSLRKKATMQRILGLAVIIILILTPLGIISMDFNAPESQINIDGEFKDWREFGGYSDSRTDQLMNPSANLIEFKAVGSSTDLYLYAKVYEQMFDRLSITIDKEDPLSIYSFYFLIDDDLNKDTGYYFNGVGADILLRIKGQSGVIVSSTIHIFSSDASTDDWNGWYQIGDLAASNGGSELEVRLPMTFLENDEFSMTAVIKDANGNEDTLDSHIGFGISLVNMELRTVPEDTFINPDKINGEQLLIEGEAKIAGGNTILEEIKLIINSREDPGDLGIFSFSLGLSEPGLDKAVQSDRIVLESKYQSTIPGFVHEYALAHKFTDPIPLMNGIKLNFMIYFLINEEVQDCRFDLILPDSAFVLSNGKLLLINNYNDYKLSMSIGDKSEGIKIDGHFSDWTGLDEEIDLDIKSVPGPDIDIDTYKMFEGENSISFFFSVKGMMLRGTSVPETPKYTSTNSKIIEIKPKLSQDPPGSDNIIKEEISKNLPDELLGEDKAFIFIDTDDNIDTGYTTDWMNIGADFCIEINGKNGQVIKNDLLRYSTEVGADWKWDHMVEIESAVDHKRLETQVEMDLVDIEPGSRYNYFIYMTDWNINNDFAGGSTPLSRAFPGSLPESLANQIDKGTGNNSRISENGEPGDHEEVGGRSTRSLKIGNSTSYLSTSDSNQYKLVRDSNGIWFAFWQTDYQVYGANSTTSSGDTWNQEMLLIGSGGKVVDTTNDAEFPSVTIERDESGGNDKIHLVCNYNIDDVLYTKLVDTGDFDNSSGSAWKVADESRAGFELVDGVVGYSINYPSITVNTTGTAHIVWTQNSSNSRLYYTHSSPGEWTKAVKIANDSAAVGFSVPTIDSDLSDNLHLAWYNYTSTNIDYKRCLNTSNSSKATSWKSANQTEDKDKIIYGANRMYFPSLATDINNNVWVMTHERVVFDIWVSRCTDKNWSAPVKLASQDDLKYPTIGTDNNGFVHAVWVNDTTDEIIYAYYTDKWNSNYSLIAADGDVKFYPSIEQHMWSSANLSGIIYLNSSNKDISFEDAGNKIDIPEFVTSIQITAVCAVIVIMNFILIRKRREIEYDQQ